METDSKVVTMSSNNMVEMIVDELEHIIAE